MNGFKTHVKHGEFLQDGTELLLERVLGEFDLAHVKVPDSADFVVLWMDLDGTDCLNKDILH